MMPTNWVRPEIIRPKLDLDNTSERIMPSPFFPYTVLNELTKAKSLRLDP